MSVYLVLKVSRLYVCVRILLFCMCVYFLLLFVVCCFAGAWAPCQFLVSGASRPWEGAYPPPEGCAYTIHHIHRIHQYINTSPQRPCVLYKHINFLLYNSTAVHPPSRSVRELYAMVYISFCRFHSVSRCRDDLTSLKSTHLWL